MMAVPDVYGGDITAPAGAACPAIVQPVPRIRPESSTSIARVQGSGVAALQPPAAKRVQYAAAPPPAPTTIDPSLFVP